MKITALAPVGLLPEVFRALTRTVSSGSTVVVGLDPKEACMTLVSTPPHLQGKHVTATFGVDSVLLAPPRQYHAVRRIVRFAGTGDCFFVAPRGFEKHLLASDFACMLRDAFASTPMCALLHEARVFLMAPTAHEECVFILEHETNCVFEVSNKGRPADFDDIALLRDGTLLASKRGHIYAYTKTDQGYVWALVGVLPKMCKRIAFGHQEIDCLYATLYYEDCTKMAELNVASAHKPDGYVCVAREFNQPYEGVVWKPIGPAGIRGASPRLFAFERRTSNSAELVTVSRFPGMSLLELARVIPSFARMHRPSTMPPAMDAMN